MSYSAKDKIIQAALELFSNEGYKGTTTKAIALAAGVNESTVFRIFGSKDNLFKELLFQNNQLIEIIDLLKNSSLDDAVGTQLLTIANLYKQMYTEHPNASKILYQCAVSSNEVEFINHIIGENAYRYLAEYFHMLQENGRIFLLTTPQKAAFYFLSMIHGAFQRNMLFHELEGGLDTNDIVSIILNGILTPNHNERT